MRSEKKVIVFRHSFWHPCECDQTPTPTVQYVMRNARFAFNSTSIFIYSLLFAGKFDNSIEPKILVLDFLMDSMPRASTLRWK